MHFYLPPWLHHGRATHPAAIFSVDLQPHGTRLATAGQDATVKIWDVNVLAKNAAPNKSTPSQADTDRAPPQGALLANVASHSSAVNCVRWAPQHHLLASGGDDAVVLVYELSDTPAFGAAEDWRVRRPLRAHSSDVTDVCWSPDAERLASASVDNTIYIWHIPSERPLHRLDGHRGLVKGVAWDPVGRYVASQSDDRTVRVWRTADWKTETVLSEPFTSAVYKENSMAFFLRLSWSPCGTQLLATNAYKSPAAHIAPMFSRASGFTDQVEFVGHREPVVSTRFSPRLYRAHPKKLAAQVAAVEEENRRNQHVEGYVPKESPDPGTVYSCLALGSKDCGATVWQATAARPFFDMTQMFDMDVIDLTWGSDGYTLVACSTDGGVMYVRFQPDELGVVLPLQEMRTILTTQWRHFGGAGDAKPLPESADQLRMEKQQQQQQNQQQNQQQQQRLAGAASSKPATAAVTAAPSRERPAADRDESVVGPDDSASELQQDFVEDTLDPENPANPSYEANKSHPQQVFAAAAAAVRENGPTPPADPKIIAAQAETRVRGGKRRITPMPVGTAPSSHVVHQQPQHLQSASLQPVAMEVEETAHTPTNVHKRPRTSSSPENDKLPHGRTSPADAAYGPRSNGTSHPPQRLAANGNASAHEQMLQRRQAPSAPSAAPPGAIPLSHAAPLYAPSIYGLSLMLLPEKKGSGQGRCRVISNDVPPTILESKEFYGSGGGYAVTCSRGGEVQWRDYHAKSSAVTALAGVAGKFAVVGTADAVLYVYSAVSGRRLTPPIGVDSAAYMLEASCIQRQGSEQLPEDERENWFVIFVSRSALCSVFDVKAKKLVVSRSAASLLARPVDAGGDGSNTEHPETQLPGKAKFYREISHCRVTEHGEPILILSDGHVFAYSRDFCSWLRVCDDSSPNSDYVRTIPSSSKVGILRSLQSGTGVKQKGLPALSGMGDLRRAAVESLAHLESLMESAIALGSAIDYRYYLTNYAARIAGAVSDDVENCVVRLRELCDRFLNSEHPAKDIKVLGMSSRDLLKNTVLPVVSANRQMQRFVAEYAESLNEVAKLCSSSKPTVDSP